MSILAEATQKVASARSDDGKLVTEGFLDVCRLVLPVVGGSGFKEPCYQAAAKSNCMHVMQLQVPQQAVLTAYIADM